MAPLRRLRPKTVEFDHFFSGRSQKFDERLHITVLAGVLLPDSGQGIRCIRPLPLAIRQQLHSRETAPATGSGANVLDFGLAEDGFDRGVAFGQRLDRQSERPFVKPSPRDRRRRSGVEHETFILASDDYRMARATRGGLLRPCAGRENGDRFAQQETFGYRPELARIFAIVAVVAEHEVLRGPAIEEEGGCGARSCRG